MLHTRIAHAGWTDTRDELQAVHELREQIDGNGTSPGLVFCSPEFDLDRLGALLREHFGDRLVGCTTAGEITPAGYRRGTLTGLTWADPQAAMETELLVPTSRRPHRPRSQPPRSDCFGILLVDGLSTAPARLIDRVPGPARMRRCIGAAAGDGLALRESHVYHGGRFHRDAAVYAQIRPGVPFRIFRTHHFEAGYDQGIVTRVDPLRNLVLEINGRPAADEYRRLSGWDPRRTDSETLACHPLMVWAGRARFVRTPREVTSDGGLVFFSPVRTGLVVSGTRPLDLLRQTRGALADLWDGFEPDCILGFESAQRRVLARRAGVEDALGDLYVENRLIGFNGYGERDADLQLDHSLVGVALGTP